MNACHRTTADLTLGFLTIGAQAAPMDVIAAAAAAGFGAAGLRISGRMPGDAWPSVDGDPAAFRRLRDAADASNVRISSVSGYYITPQTELAHLLANVRAARETGAPLIAQGCFEPDHARVVALLRDYAAAAADAGLRIALEFMPMSELKTLQQTLEVVGRTGAANLGLLIDSLHLARSGAGAKEVAAIDPGMIYLTQLCDGPRELAPGRTLFDEAMSGRMYLGDGDLDLAGLVRALPPDAEIELETPVVADASLGATQRACRAADKAAAFFQSPSAKPS
jgi:sugar phosphate isomerase/epimerase